MDCSFLNNNNNNHPKSTWVLHILTYTSLFIGSISSSLLSRFYFIHGGSSRWVSTFVQSAGFPLLFLPIYLPRLFISTKQTKTFSLFTPKLLFTCISIGLMLGINNFLFSWGTSYLPVSTSSLLLSSQLAFTLILSIILVKQSISFYNLSSVILITLSSILLGLDSSQDMPKGITQSQYFLGFMAILGAGFLFALYLPLVEIAYKKVCSFQMVMEMQVIMEFAALMVSTIGMATDDGYVEMNKESKVRFDLGTKWYWLTVGFNMVSWQLCFMGTAGLVFFTKSLTGGICTTALLPMNVLGGVLVYGDKFGVKKLVSTLVCFLGLSSYLYGEYIRMDEDERDEIMHVDVNEGVSGVVNDVV